jgi:hypothetical protein
MEKILIKTNEDVKAAISYFGKDYAAEITEITVTKPCLIISYYSEDVLSGVGYIFECIKLSDFDN